MGRNQAPAHWKLLLLWCKRYHDGGLESKVELRTQFGGRTRVPSPNAAIDNDKDGKLPPQYVWNAAHQSPFLLGGPLHDQ
jgi:hypothetical protein